MVAIISKKNAGAECLRKYCLASEKALFNQSRHDGKRTQRDGWGLAFYGPKGLSVFKSEKPVFREKELLGKKLAEAGGSRIFISHIRDASNPGNLPREKLIARKNSQPFSAGEVSFAHNGTLFIADEIYSNLGRYKKFVGGVNDSEVLFWSFMKTLDAYGDMQTALEMTRDEIKTVWISVAGEFKTKGIKEPYRGLNVFVSDGKALHALCDYGLKKGKSSLMTPGWEWGRFAVRREKDSAVISSEPLDGGNWLKTEPNSVIKISGTGELSLKTRKLQ